METINTPDPQENEWNNFERNSRMGKVLTGILLVTIGGLIIARNQGVVFAEWFYSWQMLLIAIGFVIGAKHRFRFGGWIVPIVIGSVFMIGEFVPEFHFNFSPWPVALIVIGLFMIFKPRNHNRFRKHYQHWKKEKDWQKGKDWSAWSTYNPAAGSVGEDLLEVVAVFGGAKKNVITKSFKGGEVTCVFGGAEINLMQADFEGNIYLEVNQVFGGAKLLIPAHWKIQSEVAAVFGSVEDKRPISGITTDFSKTLILTGACVFGGLEIKSY